MNSPVNETQNASAPTLFAKGNISIGWSLAWRVMLAILPLHVIAHLIASNPGGASRGLGAVAGLFALPIGNNYYLIPLALPITLFLWNWLGKMILLQRLQVQTDKFIGWSIYWRTALLNFAGLLVFSLLIALPVMLLVKDGSESGLAVIGVIGILLLPVLIVWNLNATGFAARKVSQMLVAAGAAVQRAQVVERTPKVLEPTPFALESTPLRSYLSLFDRQAHGINFYFGAGYFIASILGLFTWDIVAALIGGHSPYFSPLKYYLIVFVFIFAQTASLLLITYSVRQDWLVPLLFGAALLLLGIGQRAVYNSMEFENIRFAGIFEARFIILNFCWGFLFMGGLIAAVRSWGPKLWSLMAGITAGTLIFNLGLQVVNVLTREGYSFSVTDIISTLLDGLLFGALMYAGLALHFEQKGLRLQDAAFAQAGEQREMTIGRALFSFHGRMNRSDYWLKGFLILLPLGILNNVLTFGVATGEARAVALIIGLLSLWPGLALLIKRLHDRNRSGWFAATLLIPIANIVFVIWIIVEVWFLRGTIGPNRFGEDPM
jgi:uncharacterized membrane protein YhaH (DUF805 family)